MKEVSSSHLPQTSFLARVRGQAELVARLEDQITKERSKLAALLAAAKATSPLPLVTFVSSSSTATFRFRLLCPCRPAIFTLRMTSTT